MSKVTMKSYKVSKLDFANTLQGKAQIELGSKVSYNVGYSPNNMCKGEFTAEMVNKADEENFHIRITIVGMFEYAPGSKKEELHVETYNAIYPYARALITTVTANAGIPPIMLPFIDISNQNIYRIEMNKDKPDDFINPYQDNH